MAQRPDLQVLGADTHTESLFTMRLLDDFVPANHPVRLIPKIANEAVAKMDGLFARMHEADVTSGRPSVAPEKLLRVMLLQVLFSVFSERQRPGRQRNGYALARLR